MSVAFRLAGEASEKGAKAAEVKLARLEKAVRAYIATHRPSGSLGILAEALEEP